MCSLDLFNICNYELPQGGDQLLQKIFPLLYLQYIGLHYMCVNSSLGLTFKPLPQNPSRQCPLNGYAQQSQVTITVILLLLWNHMENTAMFKVTCSMYRSARNGHLTVTQGASMTDTLDLQAHHKSSN